MRSTFANLTGVTLNLSLLLSAVSAAALPSPPYPIARNTLSRRDVVLEGTAYLHVVPVDTSLPSGCLNSDGQWHAPGACVVYRGDPEGEGPLSSYYTVAVNGTDDFEGLNFVDGTLTTTTTDNLWEGTGPGSCANTTMEWSQFNGYQSSPGPSYSSFYIDSIPTEGSAVALKLNKTADAIPVHLIWGGLYGPTGIACNP